MLSVEDHSVSLIMVMINLGDKVLRERWGHYIKSQVHNLAEMLMKIGIDHVEISTGGSVVESLARLFASRGR